MPCAGVHEVGEAEVDRARPRAGGGPACVRARCLRLALLARGEVEPEKQAARLGVPIEEIYNARKRRQRARDRVNEMYRAELEDEGKKKR